MYESLLILGFKEWILFIKILGIDIIFLCFECGIFVGDVIKDDCGVFVLDIMGRFLLIEEDWIFLCLEWNGFFILSLFKVFYRLVLSCCFDDDFLKDWSWEEL